LAAAEARIAQARADLDLLDRGGRPSELASLEGDLARARLDLEAARKDQAALARLAEKQAATRQEVIDATRRVEQLQALIRSLEERRAALVSQSDKAAAQAKLREAEATASLARLNIERSVIRSPITGVAYEVPVRAGSYLNTGDLVASVGRLAKVRVRVYVDEPELGRVAKAMPVTITWDALPGRRWKGAVERMPAEIVALGTRQVGEVSCVIDNPGEELLPGTNVNAEILSEVVEGALTVAKEALRRSSDQAGVYLLQRDRVVWRRVTVGASSITRAQVTQGLEEGDAVALPAAKSLSNGMAVRPVLP
jgi:HlyD family secretion protein